ncbi:MAG: hypothetical protein FWG53_06315 [Clostridiales bacterium]|nr:hypothetical protein [Clostridiales bacterium]
MRALTCGSFSLSLLRLTHSEKNWSCRPPVIRTSSSLTLWLVRTPSNGMRLAADHCSMRDSAFPSLIKQ